MLLLRRQGQLVKREEIRDQVWPENMFVDFDAALNTAVRKLREALNDSADTPKFLETVSGYRFLAPAHSAFLTRTHMIHDGRPYPARVGQAE
ncbi:MAG: winged helix-turn-helix domain-containing protein [Acidobacteria bacterium]|nr:winged helix-turn-helix domain-containing protein [Acidobacteriota bacterium]